LISLKIRYNVAHCVRHANRLW